MTPVREMSVGEWVALAEKTRAAQKAYAASRNPATFEEVRRLEAQLDEAIAAFNRPKGLFDQTSVEDVKP